MRYPLYGVLQSIKFWGTENFQLIDFFQLLIWFLLLYILLSRRVFEARLVIPFFVINLILVLLFSSGYVATSLPIGFHYYRFLAYAFLMMIFLVSVAPTFLLVGNSEDTGVKSKKLVLAAFVLVYGAGLANIVSLPHYERSKIQASLSLDYLNYEKEVIKALAADSTPGRVFVEYTDGQAPFSFLSVHYIESRLRAEANRETLNGLFIQSSLSYRMPVVSANLLGARTYNVPLLFTDRAQLSDDVKVRQLQDFGVSHLVVSSASFLNRVRGYAVEPPTSIGPYHIVKILTDAPKMVSRVTKPLIGYLDLEGNLPFKFLEFYFYARNELWPNFELVNLENANDYIPELRAAIINSSHSGNDPLENKLKSKNIEIVRLNYFQPYILNHYSVWYQHNVELDSFNAVEKYFDQEFRLENQISRFRENFSEQNENPTMTWSKDGQAFEVSGLNPGQLYRVNYSFFPYWQCDGAELFRGGEERIMLASNNSTVSCNYSRWNAGSSWVGMLLSLTALVFLISRRSKKPKS
jgi:hypothetical protein